ncbi:ABC transporter permease [Roseiflexus sp. RS-1]|jgi:peptide/nickel transport system permease protein|uniref:ABC transporter permease n=1 Tax=Roseiflexus sp. (strain RS-1) TaxID=357808 RepID=UPI0000D7FF9E|nr:ABC transporter permease [Roseiflexus sp. RS-1]ABQ91413.1 binding-protein-dependent transport systems inner membrane component [Roseiflexus sp. RS-1]MBO9342930.1 ABC transporter permease [Roseiflexus sp.]
MTTFLARRVVYMIITMILASFIGFFLIELPPGSIVDIKIDQLRAQGGNVPQDQIEALKRRYGVDDPLHIKYWKWISRTLQGDFGTSFETDTPVAGIIAQRLPITFALTFGTALFAWLISIPLGVYLATNRGSIPDYIITFVQFLGIAIPNFALALILMVFAALVLRQDVGLGFFSPQYVNAPWSFAKFLNLLSNLWIPVVVLGASATAGLTRVMRANLLDVLNAQYIQTARSKGLQEHAVVWKHAVRNAVHPLVMSIGYLLPSIVVGDALAGVILNLPTLGALYLRALQATDMYLGITILMMQCIMLLLGNLIADLLLAWVDPRVRLE